MCPVTQWGDDLSSIWRSLIQGCRWPPADLGLAPLFPQLLLLWVPPAEGHEGALGEGYHMHHLHGAGGGQDLLHHHGVALLQARLVPLQLHPGRRPFLLPSAHTVILFSAGQALQVGMNLFACPQCKETFLSKMVHMGRLVPGRYLPFSLPSCLKEGKMAQELCQADSWSLQHGCPLSSFCQVPDGTFRSYCPWLGTSWWEQL